MLAVNSKRFRRPCWLLAVLASRIARRISLRTIGIRHRRKIDLRAGIESGRTELVVATVGGAPCGIRVNHLSHHANDACGALARDEKKRIATIFTVDLTTGAPAPDYGVATDAPALASFSRLKQGASMFTKSAPRLVCLVLSTWLLMGSLVLAEEAPWQQRITQRLPLLGHRNWIVIADSAYPLQSRPGIETIATGAEQMEVLKYVLAALKNSPHVWPTIYLDAELPYVPEQDAKGITAYRGELNSLVASAAKRSLPHEAIIARLDKSAETFHVLILKTNMRLPYTSVFVELDCGYWSPEAEQRLRELMKRAVQTDKGK
jgi:hypothetical protein